MVIYHTGVHIPQVIFIVITVAVVVTKGNESCGQINLSATTELKEITSPGYPDGYEDNITCRWNIYALHGDLIKIEVVDSDLGDARSGRNRFYCGQRDQVKIYDGIPPRDLVGIFCEQGTPVIRSKTSSVTVIFQSDESGNGGKGFKLKYSEDVFSHKTSPTANLYADVVVKTFTAPDFEYTSYKYVQMSWRIKSKTDGGELYIRTLRSNLKTLGCGKDSNSMLAYDGYDDKSNLLGDWCESELLEKTATGNYIYIVLNAKPFNDVRFSIQYGVNEESKGESKGSTSLGIGGIAGVSIGVIAFIGVTYLAGKILYDKYSDRCDDESNDSCGDNPASRQSLVEVNERQTTTFPDDPRPAPSAPPAGNGFEFSAPPPSYEEVIGMNK